MGKDTIEIYPKTSKLVLLGMGALIFVVLGLLFAIYRVDLGLSILLVVITSYIGVPFFGLGLIYTIYRLIHRKPSLKVDEYGIYDNSSLISIGLIRWSEIEKLHVYFFMSQKYLGIVPRDYESIVSNINPLKRVLIELNKKMVKAPINITQSMVSIPLEQVVTYSKEYI